MITIHFKSLVWGIALTLVCSGTSHAQPPTYMDPEGFTLTCIARHAGTGAQVPALGMNGYAGGFWGFATYDQFGRPLIIFDVNQLMVLPPIVARYVYYHECAHLSIPTQDEIQASCVGLQNMRRAGHIDKQGEETLGNIIRSMTYLPPQYGGSGDALWDATLQCAGR